MTGSASDDPEIRKRRLLFRAWHRGTREMDLLLGGFVENCLAGLSNAEISSLESLMEMPDPDIYNWIVGAEPPPAACDTALLYKIRDFHLGKSPAP